MKGRARPIYPPNNAPPTPPLELHTANEQPKTTYERPEAVSDEIFETFDDEDAEQLMAYGEDILAVAEETQDDAWTKWANESEVR